MTSERMKKGWPRLNACACILHTRVRTRINDEQALEEAEEGDGPSGAAAVRRATAAAPGRAAGTTNAWAVVASAAAATASTKSLRLRAALLLLPPPLMLLLLGPSVILMDDGSIPLPATARASGCPVTFVGWLGSVDGVARSRFRANAGRYLACLVSPPAPPMSAPVVGNFKGRLVGKKRGRANPSNQGGSARVVGLGMRPLTPGDYGSWGRAPVVGIVDGGKQQQRLPRR